MLTINDIRKSYGRKVILDRVSQSFPVGLTLLTGPSGAGKSTLLRLLATAEKPNSGTITWDGAPGRGATCATGNAWLCAASS
jgi:ABC-2 type transport system ATP-binding protein